MAGRREEHAVTKRTRRTQKQVASVQNADTEIWTSVLDGRYTVAVHRLGPYRGELTLRDGNRLIHRRKVTLMYGAIFGPDVVDVSAWQDIATAVVDGLNEPPEITNKGRVSGGPVA